MAEWIRKTDPTICYLQETHSNLKDTHRPRMKGLKKTFQANDDQKTQG